MSADMSFHYHINHVVKGAQIMSAWVLRTFVTRETGPMLTLLKSLIRNTAEYASVLWSPTDITNISNIENIQRRFTSKFSQFRKYNEELGYYECTVDYWQRLKQLKIYSLERRRERYMIMYMHQIHSGLVPDLGFLSDYNKRTATKYFPKCNHSAAADAQAIRYSSFFTQGPMLYNLLPKDLRQPSQATTTEEKKKLKEWFKRRLDKWLELIPDEPPTRENKSEDRAAASNSILKQMANHGREVNRKWTAVKKELDREDAAAEKAKETATDNTTQPPTTNTRKRKSKFEKQAEKSAKRMRNNMSDKWEGWL